MLTDVPRVIFDALKLTATGFVQGKIVGKRWSHPDSDRYHVFAIAKTEASAMRTPSPAIGLGIRKREQTFSILLVQRGQVEIAQI
jgi:hypothetical protein